MAWQQTPYTIPLTLAALTVVMAAFYIQHRHRVAAAKTIVLILLSGSVWLLGYTLELAGADLPTKVFWDKVLYIPVIVASTSWLIFTLQYTRREKWVNRRNLILLSIIPVITLILIFTNEYHRLIWTHSELTTKGLLIVVEHTHGVWFWVHTFYCYTLIFCGSILLIQMLIHSLRLYRWQIISLLLSAFIPLLVSVLDLLGFYPFPYLIVVLLLFPAGTLAVALSIFRFRIGDIVPVARGAVIDSISDGVIVLDAENRILDVNPTAQQLISRSRKDFIGQPVESVWPTWSSQISLDTPMTSGEIALGQKEQRIYDVRISPLTDWRSRIISYIVVLRDITERKKAEENLHESEEKFRTIFEHASDEIIYVDRSGIIVDINRKVEELFGYSREDFIGKRFMDLDFLGPDNINKIGALFTDIIAEEKPVPLILLELKRKDGSDVTAEVSTRLIKKNGEVEGILSIVRDVTERKKAEKQIKQSLKEKEVLLREIHHRVKNNLQIISSLLSLQSTYIKDKTYTDMLKESRNRIKSMALIHEKLYQSENLADIDFKEYIKDMVYELVRSYRVGRNISLVVDVEDISLSVDTAIPCGLIINELVSNSLKHAFPDKKGEISISLCSVNSIIELTVADNGVGIPDTVDFKNTETLGLRLVTILAESQLDGDIALDKTKGTVFKITFNP